MSGHDVFRSLSEKLLVANDDLWALTGFSPLTSILMPAWDFLRVRLATRDKSLRALHAKLRRLRQQLVNDTRYHCYGHGYFYQSFDRLLISGRRRTRERVREMELDTICKGRKIVDLGSNVCFLALQLSEVASAVDCVDSNPHVIEIGRAVAEHLAAKKVSFSASDYLDFLRGCDDATYDVILLLSAHISFDHTDPSHFGELLAECKRVLAPRGILVFESHPRFFENKYIGMERTFLILAHYFSVKKLGQLVYGSMLDRGRYVAYCEGT